MNNGVMTISAKNINQKDYMEIKTNEVLNFLKRYSRLKWDKGARKTRQLFPSFKIISNNCKIGINETKEIIYILERQGEVIRDVSQRYLKWVWKKLEEKKEKLEKQKEEVRISKTPEIIKVEKKEKVKKEYIDTLHIFNDYFLKIINLFSAASGIFISIYFTYNWFTNYFDNYIPVCLSLFIVISSLISYQNYKKTKKIGFFILWIVIITFSIATGINGQLSLQNNKEIKYKKQTNNNNKQLLILNEYNQKIKDIQIDILAYRKERENLLNASPDTYEDKRQDYLDVNWLLNQKNNKIKELKIELKDYQNKKEELLKNENIQIDIPEKIDFFSWMQETIKIPSNILKLVLYLLLAIFADILPPINLSIFLFIKEVKNT